MSQSGASTNMKTPMVSVYSGRGYALSKLVALAAFAVLANPGLGFAQTPATPMAAPRPNKEAPLATVLVKLREPLGSEILAALPPGMLILTQATPAGARAQDFLTRHSVSSLRPLFPQMVRARLLQGLSEDQVAGQIRGRFPERSRRAAKILPATGLDRTRSGTSAFRSTS